MSVRSLLSRWLSPQALIAVLVVVVTVAICGVLGLKSWNERAAVLARSESTTRNLAHSLAQHASRTIEAIDIVMVGVVERLEHDGFGEAQSPRMNQLLAVRVKSLPQVREFVVLGETGRWVFSSRPTLPAINNADRDYFLFHQAHADGGLQLNEPLLSRATGRSTILLTRRVNHRDGSFAGVVVAAIDIDYFEKFYETFDIGEAGGIGLLRDDGTLLVHRPFGKDNIGRSLVNSPLFKSAGTPTGYYRSVSLFDGVTKWIAYEHLPDFPIVATVASSESETLVPWRASVRNDVVIGGLLCTLVVLLGGLIAAQLQLRSKAEKTIRTSEARYRLLAENAGDVVMQLGMDGVRRYVSPAVERLLGWTPSELLGGRPTDLLRDDHRAEVEKLIADMGRTDPGRTDPGRADIGRADIGRELDRATVITQSRRKDGSYVWVETTFSLIRDNETGVPSEIITVLRDISKRKAVEEDLQAANEKLRELAATDSLTGLANRRSFDNASERECRRAERAGQPISMLLIDIDNFKNYNDRYGHQEGDHCLRQVAQAIFQAFRRPGDLAARYGGEEFAIILPETDELGAMFVAEKLRSIVEELGLEHRGTDAGVVTISTGAACVDAGLRKGVDTATLVHKADQALYEAKRAGRNKVVCASDCETQLHSVA
jgi:diguanylate cyclase (GGDEF)-like protein/PAS domain S-box-containing protein